MSEVIVDSMVAGKLSACRAGGAWVLFGGVVGTLVLDVTDLGAAIALLTRMRDESNRPPAGNGDDLSQPKNT